MPLYEVRLASTAGVICQTCQKPIRKGVQFGINGSKWRHLPDCIGDKVKKEVRGYERDKNVSRKDFKGFDKLPKSDQGRVVETFEFDKPFDHVSFRKKPEIDWHGEKKEGLAASTSSTPSLWHEESGVVQWPDDEEVQLSGERGWDEIASHQERGRGSAKSGISGSSHDPRMSSVSSGGGKYDISPSSSRNLSQTRNGERIPPTMPAPQNKARGRPVKGKKEKPSRKAAVTHEWVPPKPQSPKDVVGSSWGDAAPSWGDVGPSWGDDDTPSNNKPASDSVWDNPALKPDFESGATAEASGWGTEEWTYPGAGGQGEPVDESGFQHGAATGYQNDPNSGNTWADEGWVSWGTEAARPAMDSGWVYGTDSYPAQHDQQHSEGAYGGYGSQERAWGQGVSASWGSEPNSPDATGQANELGHALQAKPLSEFRLNPAASVFVPRGIPPAVTEEVDAKQTPSLPAAAEPLSDTTPSTTTHSFNPRSTLDSGVASTPVTCLTDADPQTADVSEQLHQVDLQVAEYKIGVSQATLEMKKANLDVMRAKLEAMEKRRAVLAGARNSAAM